MRGGVRLAAFPNAMRVLLQLIEQGGNVERGELPRAAPVAVPSPPCAEDLQWEVTESDSDNVVRVQLVLDGIRVRAEFRRPLTRQAFQIKLAEVKRDLLQQAEGLRRSRVLAGTTSTGREAALPPSDPGYPGAIPLAAPTWQPVPFLSDAEWADQNRKINDLLMRGKEP